MANLFGNKNTGAPATSRQALEMKYTTARHNLLLVIAFSVVNIVLLLTNADLYFLFSAYIPYYVVVIGMLLCGKLPDDYYDAPKEELYLLPDGFLIAMVVAAVVIIALYLLCWLFSNKNRVGWMIVALVLFAVDTAAMFLLNGISSDSLFDILFHAYVLYYLIVGVISYFKLKKLSVETTVAVNYEAAHEVAQATEAAEAVEEPVSNVYVEEEKENAQNDEHTYGRIE